jgi:ferredoxin--NADP+ reductase
MSQPGSEEKPLRVAVIGSGPAGFYSAENLLRKVPTVQVDMFDRVPTPFGLVRFGVAPDHQKIKNVTAVFDRVASDPRFRFFGNVEIGSHLGLDDLRSHYHQICFATGAQTDRRMGIPGEDLERSHTATEFVAWYNGHPDYRDCAFDLSRERVAVVGVGNVAVDVARILCRTPEELAATDIADHALDALSGSRVREVFMLGRRGPAQAAFTNQELKELGRLPGADVEVRPDEARLDALSEAEVERRDDRLLRKKLEIVGSFADRPAAGKPRKLTIRFLVSPVELRSDDAEGVAGMRLVRNVLEAGNGGALRARPTDELEDLPVDLVFRSVGYRGVPLAGLPFDETSGVIPNEGGRVIGSDGTPLTGLYVSGWIKRGPTGVIGTNKVDAARTVHSMLEDVERGNVLQPAEPDPARLEQRVRSRQPSCLSYEDWRRLDEIEVARGTPLQRPRVKFTEVSEMLDALKAGP